MKRALLVTAGTATGVAAILAVPTTQGTLGTSTSSDSATTGTSSASTPSAASAAAAATPSAGAVAPTASATTTTVSATGTDVTFRFGAIAVTVTAAGSKVTNVAVASLQESDNRSQAIDNYAVPQLVQEAIAAGSANIQGVSGATFTSEAFTQSLSSALSKLGLP
jgi:uncharacterized protein with FMN-binding domain